MTIEERLEALEKETQKLRDVIEIMNLKASISAALTARTGTASRLPSLPTFPPRIPTASFRSTDLRKLLITSSRPMPAEMISMHMGHTPEITVNDDGTAVGRWYLQDNLIFTEGSPYAGIGIQGGAFYTDKYEKIDGKWLIVETGYVRIYEESFKRPHTRMTANMHAKPAEKAE